MKKNLLLWYLLLLSYSLSAQWTNDTELNTLVAASQTGDLQSAGTSDGKTYIAWWHDVPAPQYYEMRLQLLDENGYQLFGPEGLLVNNTIPMSTYTVTWSLTVDRDNNAYIGFTGTGAGNVANVHKIKPDGTQAWGVSGISPGSGYDVKVLPLSNGEVIICWLPGNTGMMQKVAADGTAVWPNPVSILPAVSGHKSSAGELAELTGGDFVVVLHDRGGFSPSSLPYAQRYNDAGAAVWNAPVALSTTYYTSFNRRYPLLKDGDNLYFGYAGAQGIQPHGFLQRINPDGTLPWGINGSDFSTQSQLFERDVKIAYTSGSDVVWAVCEYSDASQGEVGEYVQKFDKNTGARLLSNEGKEVFPVSAAYISHQGDLRTVNDQPIFLVSDGNSNGVFAKDLLAVYLDANGDFAWPEHTRPVSNNANGVKSRIQLNRPYNGALTSVWAENRPEFGVSRPFAQRISLTCQPPEASFSVLTNNLEATFANEEVSGVDVHWDFGDGAVGAGNNPVHVYGAAGSYTACQIVSDTCGADTICKVVQVTCDLPHAAFDYFYNSAMTVTYYALAGADSVAWDFGDNTTGFGATVEHTFPDEAAYIVCMYVFNECGSDTMCREVIPIFHSTSFLVSAYKMQVSPNPSNGNCTLSMELPHSVAFSYDLLTVTGTALTTYTATLGAGTQQVPIAASLPAGTYFLQVNIDGQRGVIPILVR